MHNWMTKELHWWMMKFFVLWESCDAQCMCCNVIWSIIILCHVSKESCVLENLTKSNVTLCDNDSGWKSHRVKHGQWGISEHWIILIYMHNLTLWSILLYIKLSLNDIVFACNQSCVVLVKRSSSPPQPNWISIIHTVLFMSFRARRQSFCFI